MSSKCARPKVCYPNSQVEFEANLEHPFFVYGQGWASCAPDRTLQVYGLKVHRLQVGDILISLTPRESPSVPLTNRITTIITTATTTAVTSRQTPVTSTQVSGDQTVHTYQHIVNHHNPVSSSQQLSNIISSHQNHLLQSGSPECANSKKRRWSAPDQICDEDEQKSRRVKT